MDKEEFLKLLPRLIVEDNEIKGAIITALSGIVATKEDIRTIITEFDKRFEAMDKRFEALHDEMNKRFEAMDKRFEVLIIQMNKGFEEQRVNSERLRIELTTLSSRGGEQLQDVILNLLNDKLIKENISKSEIKREELIDKEGRIYYQNYNTDIDMVVSDGKVILIEIKFKADNRDIFDLIQKGKLFNYLNKRNFDALLLVCLEISKTNYEQAIDQHIRVLAGKIT